MRISCMGVAACLLPAADSAGTAPRLLPSAPCMSMSRSAAASAQGGGVGGGRSRRELLQRGAAAVAASAATAALSGAAIVDAAEPIEYSLVNERIFDTQRRSFLPPAPQRLIRAGTLSPLVCVGEEHSHPLHHRMEFNIIKAVHAHHQAAESNEPLAAAESSEPLAVGLETIYRHHQHLHAAESNEPLAVGLEMFYRQHQLALDRYVFRHGSLGRLKLETGWDDMWGYDFNNYTKIFRFARLNGVRLVGLNAPIQLVSMVSKQGLDGLPRELRPLLPDMDLHNERHRQRFDSAIAAVAAVHPVSGDALARMYQAQTLWDEYMSESAANYLSSRGGRMVLLAGSRHIESRDGIPDRVHRRLGGAEPFTVVPLSVDWTQDGLPDIDHPPGPSFADWVYFTQKELIV
ncbi:hypothetical protein JKP88DRAFT_350109 [Tribonema minus]|uniref:Haem-binding uptake Tiki superfamily ChaN domain-containing protein n=1 Tax=Tribonema minus TaxID=303371 RepID=A0A836CAW1_9STRA|nr:hypothetical protein JKP88DRAFT_350109 [Tribonema minus]